MSPAAGFGFEIGNTGVVTYASGDGLFKGITVIGGCVDNPDSPGYVTGQDFGYASSEPGTIGVYDTCVSEDSGKHGFCYAGNGSDGLILTVNCDATMNPCFTDGTSGFGVGVGSWSAYVDYSAGIPYSTTPEPFPTIITAPRTRSCAPSLLRGRHRSLARW